MFKASASRARIAFTMTLVICHLVPADVVYVRVIMIPVRASLGRCRLQTLLARTSACAYRRAVFDFKDLTGLVRAHVGAARATSFQSARTNVLGMVQFIVRGTIEVRALGAARASRVGIDALVILGAIIATFSAQARTLNATTLSRIENLVAIAYFGRTPSRKVVLANRQTDVDDRVIATTINLGTFFAAFTSNGDQRPLILGTIASFAFVRRIPRQRKRTGHARTSRRIPESGLGVAWIIRFVERTETRTSCGIEFRAIRKCVFAVTSSFWSTTAITRMAFAVALSNESEEKITFWSDDTRLTTASIGIPYTLRFKIANLFWAVHAFRTRLFEANCI